MKKLFFTMLAGCVLTACSSSGIRQSDFEKVTYFDSTETTLVRVDVEVPLHGVAAGEMKDSVLSAVLKCLHAYASDYETPFVMPTGLDKQAKVQEVVDGYCRQLTNEMKSWVEEGAYGCSLDITGGPKEITDAYVTYERSVEEYMGGAHGGYAIFADVYNRQTGQLTQLLDPAKEMLIQPLLRKYLKGYFETESEEEMMEELFIEDGIIPLPYSYAAPTAEGLLLIYQQYEIACYAAGMPECTLPWSEVWPYLTEEAQALLKQYEPK